MAVLEVKVPQLSESVTEATLLQWHKQAGEAVTLDENLVDVETDKVVLELPCPANGVLTQILKRDGSIVVAGEVIALVDTEAMASAESKPQEPNARDGTVRFRTGGRTGCSGGIGSGSGRSSRKTGKGRGFGNRRFRQRT